MLLTDPLFSQKCNAHSLMCLRIPQMTTISYVQYYNSNHDHVTSAARIVYFLPPLLPPRNPFFNPPNNPPLPLTFLTAVTSGAAAVATTVGFTVVENDSAEFDDEVVGAGRFFVLLLVVLTLLTGFD